MKSGNDIQVHNLDHLGIIAGLVDELELVEQINRIVGQDAREQVSAGQAVKAMVLNGLGFVTSPLYLFERYFEGQATEHLIGEGVLAKHLNDDRLGRVLDQLYVAGLSQVFLTVAMRATEKFGVKRERAHLDRRRSVSGSAQHHFTCMGSISQHPGCLRWCKRSCQMEQKWRAARHHSRLS